MEILYGGIPGRPIGDGMDGHSWWPLFENIPTEYLEAYYPLRIDGYTTVTDSGGAGFHRGGNGVEKRYVYLEPGEVSIHDDRWLTRPWGVLGGEPGGRSEKILRARRRDARSGCRRSATTSRSSRATCSSTGPRAAAAGRTGSTGRPSAVARDVSFGLVSREKAQAGYGVVLAGDGRSTSATEAERARQREERGDALAFDFGPPLEEILARCQAETGLEPPVPAEAAALVAARARRRGARPRARAGRRRMPRPA